MDEFFNVDTIYLLPNIVLIITILTEFLKGLLLEVGISDYNKKILSFIVGLLITGAITFLFNHELLNGNTVPQNIMLIFINSSILSITANGLYDTINKN